MIGEDILLDKYFFRWIEATKLRDMAFVSNSRLTGDGLGKSGPSGRPTRGRKMATLGVVLIMQPMVNGCKWLFLQVTLKSSEKWLVYYESLWINKHMVAMINNDKRCLFLGGPWHSQSHKKKVTRLRFTHYYCYPTWHDRFYSHLFTPYYIHEPRKKPSYFPLYWLVNRDPYNGLWNNPYITG